MAVVRAVGRAVRARGRVQFGRCVGPRRWSRWSSGRPGRRRPVWTVTDRAASACGTASLARWRASLRATAAVSGVAEEWPSITPSVVGGPRKPAAQKQLAVEGLQKPAAQKQLVVEGPRKPAAQSSGREEARAQDWSAFERRAAHTRPCSGGRCTGRSGPVRPTGMSRSAPPFRRIRITRSDLRASSLEDAI